MDIYYNFIGCMWSIVRYRKNICYYRYVVIVYNYSNGMLI